MGTRPINNSRRSTRRSLLFWPRARLSKEQGTKYEALCAYFLKADPFWSSFYSRVGTLEQAASWSDSPVYGQKQDIGIDLLAQTAASGEWHAIQCKCYDSEKPLPKGVCDSFFAALMNRDDISDWLIMTSAGGPGRNLEQQMSGDRSRFIDTAKMVSSGLDWTHFIEGLPYVRLIDDKKISVPADALNSRIVNALMRHGMSSEKGTETGPAGV